MDRIDTTTNRNDSSSFGSLISGILQDAQTLIAKEIAAAKIELKQEMSKGIKAGVSLGIGGFLLSFDTRFRAATELLFELRSDFRRDPLARTDRICQT